MANEENKTDGTNIACETNIMRPFLVDPKVTMGWHFPPSMLFRIQTICKEKEYPVDTAEEVESVLLSFVDYLDEK